MLISIFAFNATCLAYLLWGRGIGGLNALGPTSKERTRGFNFKLINLKMRLVYFRTMILAQP